MCVCVLGSDLGHHIRLFISVQDLSFVVLVDQCLMSHIAPEAAGKKDTFKQCPATCALLSFLELCL